MSDRSSDVLAFLGGSPARLATLDSLADGPKSEAALRAAIDTSRITLWRLLGDLEERGWVRETEAGYALTGAGRIVADRISAVEEALEAVEALGDVVDWLPLEELPFGVEHLAAATVVRPTPSDPQGPMRLATRQVEGATTVRILSHAYSPWVVEAIYEPVLAGEQSVAMVTATGVIESFLADDAIRAKLREMLRTEHLDLFHYEGPVPHVFAILDGERVGIGVDDDAGHTRAVLDVEDDAVLVWAEGVYAQYRADATRVGPDRFTA